MIVAVASGKGGTGKTTVAVALAKSVAMAIEHDSSMAGSSVQLLDCDVEEPNAHLFLSPDLTYRQEVGMLIPVVDTDRCSHCRRCAEVCAYHAIAVLGQEVLVFEQLCHGCGSCAQNCPEGAIREVLRPTAIVESGRAGRIDFAHGVLNEGESMAVPAIRALKKLQVVDVSGSLVVRDAPPGTSCPVVESLKGVNYALIVTEPTPFGLHDLKMAVELARDELGLPVGVIVNKDGVGDRGVDEYCSGQAIPILLRIPLDRRIAEACSDGIPLPLALPEYQEQFVALLRRLREETGL